MLQSRSENPLTETTGIETGQPSADGRWRLAVFAAPTDRDALIRVMRRTLEFNPIDARIAVHALPGILPEWLTADQARRAADAIRSLGIESAAVPEADLPKLLPTSTVHRINLNQEGLEVLGANGEVTDRIDWDRVAVVSVADVPLDLVRHYVPDRTSIRAAPHSKPLVTDTAKYTGAEMWIVCEDPFRALRIDHREMNYASLGQDKRESATISFLRFTHHLVQHARCAWLTPTARAFLDRAPAEQYRFDSQQQHVDATTLHVLLVRHLRDQASDNRAEDCSTEASEPRTTRLSGNNRNRPQTPPTWPEPVNELRTWARDVAQLGQPRFGELGARIELVRQALARRCNEAQGERPATPQRANEPPQPDTEGAVQLTDCLRQLEELTNRLVASPAGFSSWSEAVSELESVLARLETHPSPADHSG